MHVQSEGVTAVRPQSPRVFISYHRADGDAAERVRAHLVTHRVRTWMDRYDIPVGAYWPDEIDRALGQSSIVLGLLSADSVGSRNVKNEWDWALHNGKQLILLKTGPCVIPHSYVSVNFIEADAARFPNALDELVHLPGLAEPIDPVTSPPTRYARSSDVAVAYKVLGTGPVDFVWTPGFVSHVEHTWTLPALAEFYRRFAAFSRVVIFDKRGTGLSDRVVGVLSLEERMDDIRAVMDAAGVERAVIGGISEGVPLSLLFAATYPARTRALVLYGGSATSVQKADYPWSAMLDAYQTDLDEFARTAHERWGTLEQARDFIERMAPSAVNDAELVTWFADLLRLGLSPGAAIQLERMNKEIDVRSVLPTIRVPTLVVHRVGDRSASIDEGRYIARRIPGARLVELPGDDHFHWVGDMAAVIEPIARFVTEIASTPGAGAESVEESVLATVVTLQFADDRGASGEVVGRAAERFRGRIWTAEGHDTLASFDGPARALRFAGAVLEALGSARAGVRAGVFTGEIDIAAGGIRGPAVHVARQLAETARPGELLAGRVLRDLVAGSGIRFSALPRAASPALVEVEPLAVDAASLR
jgi:pimeloyl-ACP methyl ester carboxylesterase